MTVLDRVPVDAISAQAREVRPGRTLAALFAAVFFALGWLAGRAFLAVAWCGVAVREGWREGRMTHAGRPGPG